MPDLRHEIWETTDVIICGCGPTGAMLSGYLSQMSVHNVVLEKEPDITTDPRGIALDEDGIRLLQGLGLYDKIHSDIGSPMGVFNFIGGTTNRLDKKPFMRLNYATTEGGTGHVGFICHKQPVLEKHLRNSARKSSYSDIRCSSELISITEDDDWVYVTYVDSNGAENRIRGKFLASADGKTGFTRKRYLEPKGIRLEKTSQTTYEEVWVALNWKITLPTEKTHPDFPLWRFGYTPEEIYELFFPYEFRFLCNPNRPSVCGRFGLLEDRLWRFEYVIHKHEDGIHMASYPMMKSIVFPYITHPGSRYGLPHDVQYPEDCIKVLRCRPFNFMARSCNKWALDRVILLGDSAHVFPPFGGQGIASGFRDALALAWRLTVAVRPHFKNHNALFKAWYRERKQQLEKSLAATVENGRYVTEGNPFKIFMRDWYLWIVQLIPSWKHWLEMGQRREGMVRYQYETGMAFLKESGGLCFPQVYCISLGGKKDRGIKFTDDIIFAEEKKGLFQLVVLLDSVLDVKATKCALMDIDRLSQGEVHAHEATLIVHDPTAAPQPQIEDNVYRIATGEEFANDKKMCENRPAPEYYDMYQMKREVAGKKFVILRPDRFVYAACDTRKELNDAASKIEGVLRGS